jgi:hypothetical protein
MIHFVIFKIFLFIFQTEKIQKCKSDGLIRQTFKMRINNEK